MKNKPIKARKMWANYYSQNFLPALHQSKKSAIQCCGHEGGNQMTKKQLSLLLDYIDARILEKSEGVSASSDGGLIESMQTAAIRSDLYETTEETK